MHEKICETGINIASKEAGQQEESSASAWHTAAEWLDSGEIEAALLLEYDQHNQFISAVLVSTSQFAANNAKQVFAVLSGISEWDLDSDNISLKTLIKFFIEIGKSAIR